MATLQVMFNQALSSFQAGQLEVATREIDRALSSDPQNPDVLHLAALIAKSRYNYTKSEEYFRGSLKYSAKQPVVLSNLANLLKVMGRFADAEMLGGLLAGLLFVMPGLIVAYWPKRCWTGMKLKLA